MELEREKVREVAIYSRLDPSADIIHSRPDTLADYIHFVRHHLLLANNIQARTVC